MTSGASSTGWSSQAGTASVMDSADIGDFVSFPQGEVRRTGDAPFGTPPALISPTCSRRNRRRSRHSHRHRNRRNRGIHGNRGNRGSHGNRHSHRHSRGIRGIRHSHRSRRYRAAKR
nr:hypothetical protein GCM10020092_054860 [Actinoplanes digitatis]